jgi:hypothetical protein
MRQDVPDKNRRWAGAFRQCDGCGGRNWVGAQRCRTCGELLVGVPAVARTPVAMVGRRTADTVMTRRVKAAAVGSLAIALAAGVVLFYVLRTDAFQTSPVLADTTPAPMRAVEDTPAPPDEVEEAPPSAAEALRTAERGRKMLERGQVKGAIAALTEAARVLPHDAQIAHLYGAALWRYGAQDRAIFQLRRALNLARDNAVFREDLARALQNAGRNAEAVHVLREGEGIGIPVLPPDPPVAMGLSAEPAADAVNMGGAGKGRYAGRTSFTDADLPSRPSPITTPAAAEPSPEPPQ